MATINIYLDIDEAWTDVSTGLNFSNRAYFVEVQVNDIQWHVKTGADAPAADDVVHNWFNTRNNGRRYNQEAGERLWARRMNPDSHRIPRMVASEIA